MDVVEASDASPSPDKSPNNHENETDESDLHQDANASMLEDIHEEDHEDHDDLMSPLYITSSGENEMRSRKRNSMGKHTDERPMKRFYNNKKEKMRECFHRAVEIQANVLRSTIGFMNLMAKVLFWASLLAMCIGVIWYSRELAIHG